MTTQFKTAVPRPKTTLRQGQTLFSFKYTLYRAIIEAVIKLDLRRHACNLVMLVVTTAGVLATALFFIYYTVAKRLTENFAFKRKTNFILPVGLPPTRILMQFLFNPII